MKIITMITNILEKSVNIFKPFIPIFLLLLVLSIILHLFFNDIHFNEGFVAHRQKIFESNKFQQITLPNLKSYDIELAIPAGQTLHSTVQGNWGISTDANNEGMTIGVFRDGYSADGSIFKGKHGKLYKRMLEQGPYVLKYEIRDGKNVKIYVNNKLIHDLKNEAVPSGKLKVIGTNYHNYNKIPEEPTDRGRREIDYIKFIPKEMNKTKEGFISKRKQLWADYEGMEAMNISNEQLSKAFKTVKEHPEIVKEIGSMVMEQMNNKKNTPGNSHPQLQKNLMQILNSSGLGNMPAISLKEGLISGKSNALTKRTTPDIILQNKTPSPPPLRNNISKAEQEYLEQQMKMRKDLELHFRENETIDKKTIMNIGNKYKPSSLTTDKEKIFLTFINKLFANGPINRTKAANLMGGSLNITDSNIVKNNVIAPENNNNNKQIIDASSDKFEAAVQAAENSMGKESFTNWLY